MPPHTAMPIIDTHQHLWDMDQFRYAWCEPYPHLNRSFRMHDYLAAAEGLGIDGTVYVDADVDEPFLLEETLFLLALAEAPDNPLLGVVAGSRPESGGFPRYLDRIGLHTSLKGLRRVLHTQPDELSRTALFVDNLRRLPAFGLSFDLCVLARQLPLALNLVRQCPEVNFVLDHCGVPRVREKDLDPWRQNLCELAAFPNVACKISGLVAYADPQHWTPDDLRPFIDHALACFGWDRVLFGSDWPVCTVSASLRRWVETLLLLTHDAGIENQRKLFHDNAVRMYRLKE